MKKTLVIFSLICTFAYGCNGAKATFPDHITLTWSDDPHTTQTITWRTNIEETQGEVQYTNVEDSSYFAAKEINLKEDSSDKFKTDAGTWMIHTVTLKGLKPGKTYCYRVGYGSNWSGKSTFVTEDNDTRGFKFLLFGDSQSGNPINPNYTVFDSTIHNAYKANPDSKFFINMGDLVEIGGYYNHWNNWFDAVKDIINKIPIMPVVGNHDTYYNTFGSSGKPVNFIRQFKVPQQNVPDGLKGQIYSYDYGDVHFAVWDSQIEEEKPDKATLLKELDWLRKDLIANKDKTWKVVLFHKTPYYNKVSRSNDTLKALLQPILDSNYVDIVLNGHDHGVSYTYPIKNDEFMQKPSQGTIYYITGRSGNKSYEDLTTKVWNAFFYDPLDKPNYVVAQANINKFKLTAFKQDGTFIDSLIIDKSKDELIPTTMKPAKFKETRLVIFGKLLADSVKAVNKDNKWYVPAQAFVEYLHGRITKKENTLKITIKGTSGDLIIKHFQPNINTDMISADEIKAELGYNYQYSDSMNMIMFSKD